MIKSLSRKATIRLINGIKNQAERDIEQFGKTWSSTGGGYVSLAARDSAVHFLNEDLPVIKEILTGSIKE